MPVKRCSDGSSPGYKYGDSGKCYTYKSGDETSRKAARKKALRQGRAIEVNKASESVIKDIEQGYIELDFLFHYNDKNYFYSESVENNEIVLYECQAENCDRH